jgi:hypothetical protein
MSQWTEMLVGLFLRAVLVGLVAYVVGRGCAEILGYSLGWDSALPALLEALAGVAAGGAGVARTGGRC